ncbi:aromatic ring-hydroxylating oxygenase subunit alpha [Novosphingobium malaysiense]|uniref:aromatic ring-hydroxylating oxygenase subunit alpha n=1 Tax=Novosphingobium malaysiense TaxID=1348853 RepID=UPI0018CEE398|nr:aromatic ring-hydroxylating dioxygenase subunit alpha [Novosphingobium malaysiense]
MDEPKVLNVTADPERGGSKRLPIELWEGLTYQDILDIDETFQPVSDIVREHRMVDLGSEPVSARRYTDPEFFKLEVEHVFLKTWQYACREEEIRNPGDTYIFDIVNRSVLVTRQNDGSIRAFENICLHRGRKLADRGGCKKQFWCPYHGFTWNIDGTFKPGPVAWDFPEIDADNFPLGEVKVARWAGFVFVNFDANCKPFEEVADPLPRHMDYWMIDHVYKAAHVAKVLPANWKVCAEAFLENHHVGATHPQVSPYTPDANAQYDVLSDHVTRAISPHGYPGLVYAGPKLSPQEILDLAMKNGNKAGASAGIEFGPDMTERRYLAITGRKNLSERTGRDLSERCDADFLDGFSHDLFPNFHLWGSLATKIGYRFRPVGLDHEQCLMEVFLWKLAPKDQPAPAPATMQLLRPDQKWADCTGDLAYLAGVYDQDESNIPSVQEGLRALGDRDVHFGRYSEIRCRNLHRMIDKYIEAGEQVAKLDGQA